VRLFSGPPSCRPAFSSKFPLPNLLFTRNLFIFATLFCAVCAAQPGAVSGSVVDDTGKPVAANVRISKLDGSSIKGGPPSNISVTTKPDGSFALASLSAGNYLVCAQPVAGNYLDPCIWSVSPPTVKIAAGQLTKGFLVVTKKGTSVTIHLADDDHILTPATPLSALLTPAAPTQAAPHIFVGVLTLHKTFEPAPLVGSDANGRDHQATIPSGQPVDIQVTAQQATITDNTGAPLSAAGAHFTVNQAPTDPPGLITVHVHK
jgi:hypothetical protein